MFFSKVTLGIWWHIMYLCYLFWCIFVFFCDKLKWIHDDILHTCVFFMIFWLWWHIYMWITSLRENGNWINIKPMLISIGNVAWCSNQWKYIWKTWHWISVFVATVMIHWDISWFNQIIVPCGIWLRIWMCKFETQLGVWYLEYSHQHGPRFNARGNGKKVDGKSTLVQVMAWCHKAPSPYLNHCWPRLVWKYSVIRPHWVNSDHKK